MKNNKKLCVALLAAGVCVASTGYAAVDGTYVTGQLGVAFLSDEAIGNGAGPYMHFALGDQLNRYLALEVGGTVIPTTAGGSGWLAGGSAQFYSLDGDVKAMLPLSDRFSLYAKIGPSLAHYENDYWHTNGIMGNGALGISYDVTEHWTTDLSVGTMYGNNETFMLSTQLGLGYHFA